jgi:hypothetical protein
MQLSVKPSIPSSAFLIKSWSGGRGVFPELQAEPDYRFNPFEVRHVADDRP